MLITKVEIDGFKNLSEISFVPDTYYNIIVGANAQGKTNLLEALWIMSGCKSFRGSKERDYIALDKSRFTSEIGIYDNFRQQKITYEMLKGANITKNITINGVKQKGTRNLFDVFKCIAFIPDDVEIIKGAPEKRRNFIDMAASQLNPLFVAHITKFQAVMNQRNALLKSILQGESDSSILEIWDKQAAHEGALISYMRDGYIKKLNGVCSELYSSISGGKERLELEYKSNVFKAEDFSEPCNTLSYEKYFNKLRESEDYDIRTGITHSGVNRDEINVKINGISAKEYGSQGQIKSAALVIKLAQAEIFMERSKEAPVVFLDDVMGELDENRQRFVFDIIRNMQVFITTPNESALLPELKGKILRMNGGRLTEEKSDE